ncbi:glycosyltransferase [Dechloromonas sp. XY25]|uniref:Glycosyltransferase n=1 Tax=Dechloromonas hankyongensis TaxID=2908002 RepID=A0ABS9K669_9RHOO|nr:glycosyltransferase [Dechloromonas hankyongensis]MCG2578662.1 glycosyltransferase [Dechloromonas hankyongensis]
MLRPLFVTGSLAHGGAERHSITLVNRLAERGHDCHALYLKADADQLPRLRRPAAHVRGLGAEGFFDRQAVRDCADHIARIRPSVLVAANGYALLHASLAQRRSGLPIPVIATFHTTTVDSGREQLKLLIERPFFWRAWATVFVCAAQKRHWLHRGLGSRRNPVIYNGVDVEHFHNRFTADERQALRRVIGLGEADYVIGISAVLRPEKNHRQLVDALTVLRQLGLPAHLLVIGDGPQRAALEAQARTAGVAEQLHITGFVQDVRPYLAACDVVVLCSLSIETFSLAALEAMAMGKPVVHSNIGGAAEMIEPGRNGHLFAAGDTIDLVSCLAVLAEHRYATQMGTAARQLVEARFSEGCMVDRYERLLAEAVRQHPVAARTGGLPESHVKQGASSHENV